MRTGLLLILCLFVVVRPAAAQYQPDYEVQQYALQNWELFTMELAPDEFSYCGARAHHGEETALLISIGCTGLQVSVEAFGQRLAPGQAFPVIVHIDMETVFAPIQATVYGPPGDNILLIQFGWDSEAFEALRRGNTLTVLARDFGYDFFLTGSSRALAQVDQCAVSHMQRGLSADRPALWQRSPAFHAACPL